MLNDAPLDAAASGRLEDQGTVILGRGPGVSGPGEVVRLLFRAIKPGVSKVQLKEAVLVNEERQRKDFQVVSGALTIEAADGLSPESLR